MAKGLQLEVKYFVIFHARLDYKHGSRGNGTKTKNPKPAGPG